MLRLRHLVTVPILLSVIAIAMAAQDNSRGGWQVTTGKIRQVQSELRRRGYLRTEPTGTLNRSTREALRRYQIDQRLPLTARVDRPTFESLGLDAPDLAEERSGPPPPPPPAPFRESTSERPGLPARATTAAVSTVARGLKGPARTLQRIDREVLGRQDRSILREIVELINRQPEREVRYWAATVRDGLVTIDIPALNRHDPGPVVSEIRQVAGVRAVLVVVR